MLNQSKISNEILDIEMLKDKTFKNIQQKSEFLYKMKIGIDFIFNILRFFVPKFFTQDEYTVRNYVFAAYNISQDQKFSNISIPFNHYCLKKHLSLAIITGSNEIIIMILIKMGINSGQLYDDETRTVYFLENYKIKARFIDEIIRYFLNISSILIFQLLIAIIFGEVYSLFIRLYFKKQLITKGSILGLILNLIFLIAVFLIKVVWLTYLISRSIISKVTLKIFSILAIEGVIINVVVHFL